MDVAAGGLAPASGVDEGLAGTSVVVELVAGCALEFELLLPLLVGREFDRGVVVLLDLLAGPRFVWWEWLEASHGRANKGNGHEGGKESRERVHEVLLHAVCGIAAGKRIKEMYRVSIHFY